MNDGEGSRKERAALLFYSLNPASPKNQATTQAFYTQIL
jgi:hypothetical protein